MILITKLYQCAGSFVLLKKEIMNRTIFITGTSTGLGRLTAQFFAEKGWNVAATMRSPEKEIVLQQHTNIKVIKLDVADTAQVQQAVKEAIDAFGKIDVVVNNAGVGMYGALEFAKEEDIDWQFAVNARGPINVIRAFLPHFRAQGGGKFINISSFMGITTAVPLGSLYNMSKFALEGLVEGLYYELKPLNISLHLVEQGGSSGNNFVQNVAWSTSSEVEVYNTLTKKLKTLMETRDEAQIDNPMDIVQVIDELASGKRNTFRNIIGNTGNGLMAMRASMPIEEYLEKMAGNFR